MPSCVSCTAGVTTKSPGLQCTGQCQKFFHGKCVDLSKADINRFAETGVLWMCNSCRDKTGSNKRKSFIVSESDDDGNMAFIRTTLHDIQESVKSLNRKYDDLLESVSFCSNQVSAFEASLKRFNEKIQAMEKINIENVQLKNAVADLNSKVDALEQNNRINNIEIQGVPYKNNENLLSILEKIGDHIQCPILPSHVDTVHRVTQHQSSDLPKPIVVKLLSKQKRDTILAAAKTKRLSYSAQSTPGLIIEGVSNRMFINEHLTSRMKILLKKTKEICKAKGYRFVWVRNCSILVRRDDKSKILTIRSEDDAVKLN